MSELHSIGRDVAIALAETKWWEGKTAREICDVGTVSTFPATELSGGKGLGVFNEKNLRCTLGGFKVLKGGMCTEHEDPAID